MLLAKRIMIDPTDGLQAMASLTGSITGSMAPTDGSSSHLYRVRCCADGAAPWQVLQPYSAFRALYKRLQKHGRHKEGLPPMPPKYYVKGSGNDAVVKEREAGLVPVVEVVAEDMLSGHAP